MIACTVSVAGLTYMCLCRSTCAAVLDAMDRYPTATSISARARP